jgi:hypothetical protein
MSGERRRAWQVELMRLAGDGFPTPLLLAGVGFVDWLELSTGILNLNPRKQNFPKLTTRSALSITNRRRRRMIRLVVFYATLVFAHRIMSLLVPLLCKRRFVPDQEE